MEAVTCCECGIVFGVPNHWLAMRREDKRRFLCPNGHGQSFTESEADRLRRERDLLRKQLAQKDDSIQFWRQRKEAADRSMSAARGHVTKLRRRIKAGTCPCCNRTFANMSEHMRRQHPDFDPADTGIEIERHAKH